jgi:hypothetical protein
MLGVVAAHLLSRQRPRAIALATARFLPTGMLEATTVQRAPRDRWWMFLRLVVIALLSLGMAKPVFTGSRVTLRTVLLLDRALPIETQQRALDSLASDAVVIAYDSVATLQSPNTAKTSLARASSLSAGLARLVRVRDSLLHGSTRLQVVIASPFAPTSLDPVTRTIRALLPDSIAVRSVVLPSVTTLPRGMVTVRSTGDDPLAATALLLGDSVVAATSIVQRGGVLLQADSTAARAGATVVWWPARTLTTAPRVRALTVQRTTWLAPFEPVPVNALGNGARVIGWWEDGAPAAWLITLDRGCVVHVGAAMPEAGDHALSLGAQAMLRTLLTVCDSGNATVYAPPVWLSPPPRTLSASDSTASLTSKLAPWLVGASLLLALCELVLRRVRNV